MPGRQFSASSYRYGFNGKENDPESGTQDYGMRIYNPALGKFLSVDPLTKSYPMLTPYQFASNTPIMAIDLDGEEQFTVIRPTSNARPIMTNRPGNGGYPRGRSAGRGTWGVPHVGDNVETNLTIQGHTNYKFVDQNVWFDANGHPQTDVVETPILKPMEDPVAKKLQNNLNETKLAEANKDDKYIYRAMGVGADGKPQIPFNPNPDPKEITGKMLGIRPQDIEGLLNGDGTVSPGLDRGGMSMSSEYHAEAFAPHIAADILSGKRTVFKILKTDLMEAGFILDKDGPTHISLQPGETMKVEDFQQSVLKTREKWTPK